MLTQTNGANGVFSLPVLSHGQSTHSKDSVIRVHGIKSEASPKRLLATSEPLCWTMHLLWALLLWLSLSNGLGANCPGRCSCDSLQSVQCYRLLEVPSGIPSTTRRLYISHSRIQHLQVTMPFPVKVATVLFLGQGVGRESSYLKSASSRVKLLYSLLLGVSEMLYASEYVFSGN